MMVEIVLKKTWRYIHQLVSKSNCCSEAKLQNIDVDLCISEDVNVNWYGKSDIFIQIFCDCLLSHVNWRFYLGLLFIKLMWRVFSFHNLLDRFIKIHMSFYQSRWPLLRSIIFINKYFIKSMQKIFHLHFSGRLAVYILLSNPTDSSFN